MMLIKLIYSDLSRKRMINLSLFLFILLPAMLTANAISLIFSLSVSLDRLFERAKVPHFVQMHAGELNPDEINNWNRSRSGDIEEFQAVEMIIIDAADLYLSGNGESEAASVMDIGFVRQNRSFDFLLDLENNIVDVNRGEIAVPLYYREKHGLKPGDSLSLKSGGLQRTFRIAGFSRDAQMNPSIVHSKRFVVSDSDFALLKELFPESEYLLEYRLTNFSRTREFADAYARAGLPSSGPTVDIGLFRLINAVNDGLVITLLILLSLLFSITAVLCLRFTLLASMEEDYREIGIMKGLGFPQGFVRNIYLGKYLVMGVVASLLGYGLSFSLHRELSSHIRLYMGDVVRGFSGYILPAAGAGSVLLIVWISCLIVLRRFNSISAVEALRAGRELSKNRGIRILSLKRFALPGFNLTLALRTYY